METRKSQNTVEKNYIVGGWLFYKGTAIFVEYYAVACSKKEAKKKTRLHILAEYPKGYRLLRFMLSAKENKNGRQDNYIE